MVFGTPDGGRQIVDLNLTTAASKVSSVAKWTSSLRGALSHTCSGCLEGKHYKHQLPVHKKYLHKSVFLKKIIYTIYKSDQFFLKLFVVFFISRPVLHTCCAKEHQKKVCIGDYVSWHLGHFASRSIPLLCRFSPRAKVPWMIDHMKTFNFGEHSLAHKSLIQSKAVVVRGETSSGVWFARELYPDLKPNKNVTCIETSSSVQKSKTKQKCNLYLYSVCTKFIHKFHKTYVCTVIGCLTC